MIFRDVFNSGVYFAFCTDARKSKRFDKIDLMVNSLMSVIHSNPNINPNKSMMRGSTYLRENNYIFIYPKTLRGAFHDNYDKGVYCE